MFLVKDKASNDEKCILKKVGGARKREIDCCFVPGGGVSDGQITLTLTRTLPLPGGVLRRD